MITISVIENWNEAEIFNAEIFHAFMSCIASIFLPFYMSNR